MQLNKEKIKTYVLSIIFYTTVWKKKLFKNIKREENILEYG
jgi:hypothetical protein